MCKEESNGQISSYGVERGSAVSWVVPALPHLCCSVRIVLNAGLPSARKPECHLKNKPATASTHCPETLSPLLLHSSFFFFPLCLSIKCHCVDVKRVSFVHFQRHNEPCVHNLKTNQTFLCINHWVNHCAGGAQNPLAGSDAHHFPPFKGFLSQWFVNRADNRL